MNKKTYGEGVRHERTDHTVVAETIAAKEKLRDQLGHGEEFRTEELSRVEFLRRKLADADAAVEAAEDAVEAAYIMRGKAWIEQENIAMELKEAMKEEGNA